MIERRSNSGREPECIPSLVNDSEEQNQALQNLQSSLSNGNLMSALSSLQTLFQSAATASGSSLSS
jgi:hypothetical protein